MDGSSNRSMKSDSFDLDQMVFLNRHPESRIRSHQSEWPVAACLAWLCICGSLGCGAHGDKPVTPSGMPATEGTLNDAAGQSGSSGNSASSQAGNASLEPASSGAFQFVDR